MADRVRWVSRRGRYKSPVSLSPRRLGVDFHRREGVPSSSTISTPSTQGPTERVLPVSPFEHRKCSSLITKCNTVVALGDVKKKKKEKRREGQGKKTPVEPLEMSVGWYLRQAGSFRSNKAAASSVRKRAWILINIILPLIPFTLI